MPLAELPLVDVLNSLTVYFGKQLQAATRCEKIRLPQRCAPPVGPGYMGTIYFRRFTSREMDITHLAASGREG
jgi:hypothetical protein